MSDLTLCNGEKCGLKNDCLRYYLNVKEKVTENNSYLFSEACVNDNYFYFIPTLKGEKE